MTTPPPDLRPRLGPLLGIGAAAAAAVAGVVVGVAADRAHRQRRAMLALEAPDSFAITPDEERVVVAVDGVPLHVEIDLPTPEAAAEAARGTTSGDRPELLPTVVLSHGYCLSLRCWVYQRRALKEAGYRVVSWDQRGHGQSGKGDASSYVVDRLGQDLKAVIDEAVPTGDLVLVGHSMGGMTIMTMGEQFPDLVRERVIGVALIATSAGGMTLANGGKVATFGRLLLEKVGPSVLGRLSKQPEVFASVRKAARNLEDFMVEQNSFASPVSHATVRYTSDILLSTPLDVIRDFLTTFDGFDQRPALRHFRDIMVLVFNGRQDILTPPAHSDGIVEGIPGAEHVVVNDAGHVIMLEHPELLNAHLIQLVDQAARARAEAIDLSQQPRVRRIITDVAKRRRIQQLERRASELAKSQRRRGSRHQTDQTDQTTDQTAQDDEDARGA